MLDFFGYDRKQNVDNYLKGIILSMDRVQASVATMVVSLLWKEKRGAHHRRGFCNTYGRTVETET